MGRKPTKNANLPPRMRLRKRGAKIWYYYDTGGKPRKEIPLGSDYAIALKKWAELQIDSKPRHSDIITFRYVTERYLKEVLPKKALNTQKGNIKELSNLYKFFDVPPVPIDKIQPIHVRQYLDWRIGQGAKVAANREKALLSHIFNKSREWGYTDKANPCSGVKGTKEQGRKSIYIEDEIYDAVYQAASVPLQDAMALAYLTAQRPSDVLRMSERDIKDNFIEITQNKTQKRLRISIEGELSELINKIMSRKSGYKIRCLNLIVNHKGQPFTAVMLKQHFNKARDLAGVDKSQFQFRDLRAKAGTDKAESSGDIRQAQRQLGHANVTMTEHYTRNRKGDKVTPTK